MIDQQTDHDYTYPGANVVRHCIVNNMYTQAEPGGVSLPHTHTHDACFFCFLLCCCCRCYNKSIVCTPKTAPAFEKNGWVLGCVCGGLARPCCCCVGVSQSHALMPANACNKTVCTHQWAYVECVHTFGVAEMPAGKRDMYRERFEQFRGLSSPHFFYFPLFGCALCLSLDRCYTYRTCAQHDVCLNREFASMRRIYRRNLQDAPLATPHMCDIYMRAVRVWCLLSVSLWVCVCERGWLYRGVLTIAMLSPNKNLYTRMRRRYQECLRMWALIKTHEKRDQKNNGEKWCGWCDGGWIHFHPHVHTHCSQRHRAHTINLNEWPFTIYVGPLLVDMQQHKSFLHPLVTDFPLALHIMTVYAICYRRSSSNILTRFYKWLYCNSSQFIS